MSTSKPPYVFPQQKPTKESGDSDGHILIIRGTLGFYWREKADLQDGEVWVPGCDNFFRDHGDGPNDVRQKMGCADRKWNVVVAPKSDE